MWGTMVLAFSAILASTIAQAMLKHGMTSVGSISPPGSQFLSSMQKVFTEPFILGGMALVILVLPVWLEVLSRLPFSIAYPLVSTGYVFSLVIAVLIFKEAITPLRIFGVVLIMGGVVAVSSS